MRCPRRDNSERRFNVEEFLTAQEIQSYFLRTATKLKHAVTAQSGHDSIDDNDSQVAQELLFCPLSCPSPMRAIASHCLRCAEHMFFVQQQQAD